MITVYHRPQALSEALLLLSQPDTRPLGGGTWLNQPHDEKWAVVDLQLLGLDGIETQGGELKIGATCTLQSLVDSTAVPQALRTAARLEAPLNLRNMGTAAGTLVASGGRSPFATTMLALDARLTLAGGTPAVVGVGDVFALREEILRGKLITQISVPLNVKLAYEYVARSAADLPIVAAAACQWSSGRTRLALGGYGRAPVLALDGTESDGVEAAARNAYHEAADEWASAEYRIDVAATLAQRCLDNLR